MRCGFTYEFPAPLPAPATPFPAAVTTAPAALPTPPAAADAVLDMALDAVLVARVIHDWFWGTGMCCCFFATAVLFCGFTGGGIGFFAGFTAVFFCVEIDVTGGFLAVVVAMGALRTAVGVDFLVVVDGRAFLVPMGWATILDYLIAVFQVGSIVRFEILRSNFV